MSTLFPLGQCVATPGAMAALEAAAESPSVFVERHARGDWGAVSAEDAKANGEAVASGERILSVYRTASGIEVWVITEADRSSTCVLLPDEY